MPTQVYAPINKLKKVIAGIWIVDGPVIRFGAPFLKLPFSTRMTIIRLRDAKLFVHSPTPLLPELRGQLRRTGQPHFIIAPNRLHYWWIPEWRAAFPDAAVYLAPCTKQQAGARLRFDGLALDAERGYPWDAEIATLPIAGGYLTEVVFFHTATRTLILADLIENFEAHKLGSYLARLLTRLGGVQDPDGQMPRDLRLTFRKHKAQLRAAVQKMIAWNPERIILAHGRWYRAHGAHELHRAFRWLLA